MKRDLPIRLVLRSFPEFPRDIFDHWTNFFHRRLQAIRADVPFLGPVPTFVILASVDAIIVLGVLSRIVWLFFLSGAYVAAANRRAVIS
jgi:hypothetical protein